MNKLCSVSQRLCPITLHAQDGTSDSCSTRINLTLAVRITLGVAKFWGPVGAASVSLCQNRVSCYEVRWQRRGPAISTFLCSILSIKLSIQYLHGSRISNIRRCPVTQFCSCGIRTLHTGLTHMEKPHSYVRMLVMDFNTVIPYKLINKLNIMGLIPFSVTGSWTFSQADLSRWE